MNLTYTRPGELRKPDVEVLPDGRIRITRYIAAGHGDRDYGEVTTAVGTTDNGLNTALLVKRGMTRVEGKDAIVLTYEVRNASTETKVGLEDVQFGENGLKTVIADWVQMSSGTYTPQTVGTTASTYDATCILRQETMEDDGTTRQIRRIYVNKGLINQIDEIRNNGKLLLKTLVYLNDAPSPNPPTGYTLISTRVENPLGLETTSYTFAKGDGLINTNSETRLQGLLLRTTLTYLTDPSVTVNPTSDPFGTGGTVVSTDVREADGYKAWTVTWVKAVSTDNVTESTETRNGGKLIIYRRSKLGSAPSAPSATIGGTVTLISDQTEKQDGYVAYTRTWAEGVGQISQDDDTRNGGALLLRTIRHLSAGSVTSNPISTPVGYTLVSSTYAEQDGYKLWTASFAKGDGIINSSTEYRNKGKLVVYKTTKLGTAPSTPAATIGGTVVLIDSTTRQQDGYVLYDYTWAEGYGTITSETDSRNQGKLKVYHIVSLGVDPSTPAATIGGTVVLIENATREESGVTIYDKRWAEGYGVIQKSIAVRDGGLRLETWVSIGGAYDGSFMQPVGVVMMKDSQDNDGVTRWTVTCMQGATGGSPTAYSYSTESYVKFNYPGRAGWSTATTTGGGQAIDLFLTPPVSALVLATTTISYQTTSTVGSLTNALWNPTNWATVFGVVNELAANGQPKTIGQGLEGYTTWSGYSTATMTAGSPSRSSFMGYWLAASSSATGTISGGPTMPDGSTTYTLIASVEKEPAFVAYDGTLYYRKVVVTATPPAPGGPTP